MEYTILEANSAPALVALVNARLTQGWRVSSDLVVLASSSGSGKWWYYQSMLRGPAEKDGVRPN